MTASKHALEGTICDFKNTISSFYSETDYGGFINLQKIKAAICYL